jgi:hypothetical protein
MNRVPVVSAPALDAGKLLHQAFELHEKTGDPLDLSLKACCLAFRTKIPDEHPAAHVNLYKSVETMEDLIEAMPLWKDKFPITEVLEVEQPSEWQDPVQLDVMWLVRPDKVIVLNKRIWHQQRRGLAASVNFGMYTRLAKRHYHEHLYGLVLSDKYKSRRLKYGGTLFDLTRKLKFRTNVGKKNEATKTAEEMFYQQPVTYDLKSPLHKSVMWALREHVRGMREVTRNWEEKQIIPAPNDKMNGGYGGNSEDPYFRVLIGEIGLDNDEVFKAREDTYANLVTE